MVKSRKKIEKTIGGRHFVEYEPMGYAWGESIKEVCELIKPISIKLPRGPFWLGIL